MLKLRDALHDILIVFLCVFCDPRPRPVFSSGMHSEGEESRFGRGGHNGSTCDGLCREEQSNLAFHETPEHDRPGTDTKRGIADGGIVVPMALVAPAEVQEVTEQVLEVLKGRRHQRLELQDTKQE